jgi:nitrogen fixation protein
MSRSRDSVVGIATGYGLDDGRVGVRVPVDQEFSILHVLQTRFWGPPILLSNGYRDSFPGVKAAEA